MMTNIIKFLLGFVAEDKAAYRLLASIRVGRK
jgi:hypothetical protein